MPQIEKTVFISYRRTNIYNALAVYQDLTAHGYDVFLDYERINSGDFSQVIVENIKARAHFIVILTPSALERCDDPNDWLRKEIECALDNKRNIVPLMMEGFDYSSPSIENHLVGKLSLLKNYNAQWVPAEFFQEAMARVRDRFLHTTIESVLHPLSTSANNEAKQQKIIADAQAIVTENTLTAEEYFEQGFQHVENHNYDDAIISYSEVISLMPEEVGHSPLFGGIVLPWLLPYRAMQNRVGTLPRLNSRVQSYHCRSDRHIASGYPATQE